MKKNKANVLVSVILLVFYVVTYVIDIYTTKTIDSYSFVLNVFAVIVFLIFLRKLPVLYYQSILFFTFCAEFLGASLNFYTIIPIYDLILHFLSGILLVFAAHYIVEEIIAKKTKQIPTIGLSCYACFMSSVAGAALWEIWEFCGDLIFDLNAQGVGINDTMEDILAGTIGAVIGTAILFFYIKKRKVNH